MPEKADQLYVRELIWGGVWGALALFLPILLHPFGLGVHLMPMFLPLLIAACTLRPRTAVLLAILAPFLSGVATGMPPLYPPVALLMALEGAAMVLWLAFSYRRRGWNIYFSLAAAFLLQRVVRVGFIFLAGQVIDLPAAWLIVPALFWGLPGAVIQTAVIPGVVGRIRARFPGPALPGEPPRERQSPDWLENQREKMDVFDCHPRGCQSPDWLENQREKMDFFDRLAPSWHQANTLTPREETLIREMLPPSWAASSGPILDLGGGTGRLAEFLGRVFPVRLLLLDLSYRMLQESLSGGSPVPVYRLQGDAHRIPLRRESVGLIYCFCTFPHFDRKEEVIRECRRILLPGGWLIVLHDCGREEVNRFHSAQSPVIAADHLPDLESFRVWGERTGMIAERLEDSGERFLVRYRKPFS